MDHIKTAMPPIAALKTIAIAAMILDHLGAYVLPEVATLRAIGRCAAPVFFVLIGFGGARRVPASWWAGAIVLSIALSFDSGKTVFNLLLTMAAIRLLLTFCEKSGWSEKYWPVMLATLAFVPGVLVDGTLQYAVTGPLSAAIGVVARRVPNALNVMLIILMMVAVAAIESRSFESREMVIACGAVLVSLSAAVFLRTAVNPRGVWTWPSRHSLVIYVTHLLALLAWKHLL